MSLSPPPLTTPVDDDSRMHGKKQINVAWQQWFQNVYTYLGGALSGIFSLNGGQLAGLRNRIINGDMRVDQRNNGSAVTPTAATYLVDRWYYYTNIASKLTFQQVSDAPTGFKYSLKVSVAAQYSPANVDSFVVWQPIEGLNVIDLNLGTASAATITCTVWIKGSIAGTYTCYLGNGTGARSYVGTIAVTTSWAKQTITLIGDTTGTWPTDNTTGLRLGVDLGSGINQSTTAGVWQAGFFARTAGSVTFVNQVNGSTLNITGVQLELGSTATTFEQRPYGLEFALCQRYLPASNGVGVIANGHAFSATNALVTFPFQVPPRVPPTGVSVANAANFNVWDGGGNLIACTSIGLYGYAGSYGVILQPVVAAGLTLGRATSLNASNANCQILLTGSEL